MKMSNSIIMITTCIILSACQSATGTISNVTSPPVTTNELEDTDSTASSVYFNDYPHVVIDDWGDGGGFISSKMETNKYGIPEIVSQLVEPEKVEKWMDQVYAGKTKMTVANFLSDLKITREQIEKSGIPFSKELIDLWYSTDPTVRDREKPNPYAMVINNNIYTPDWLGSRTVTEFEKNGIPLEDISLHLKIIDDYVSSEEYLAVKSTLKRAVKAGKMITKGDLDVQSRWELAAPYRLEYYGIPEFAYDLVNSDELVKWMDGFVLEDEESISRDSREYNVINFVRELKIAKQDFIRANNNLIYTSEEIEAIYSADPKQVIEVFGNPYNLIVGGNVYSIKWLASEIAEKYKEAGITKDVLKAFLDKINDKPVLKEEIELITNQYNQL